MAACESKRRGQCFHRPDYPNVSLHGPFVRRSAHDPQAEEDELKSTTQADSTNIWVIDLDPRGPAGPGSGSLRTSRTWFWIPEDQQDLVLDPRGPAGPGSGSLRTSRTWFWIPEDQQDLVLVVWTVTINNRRPRRINMSLPSRS
ncbi:hypothetical protein EYF80_066791 [Liparis tanakae]|uniref:Uncharacterized protein n=1 Tax=Liparis tanakae TaxID=230148 RepID=A0A4Z2E3Z8_9TELE|nr:hypothetical protein EYF80_066791 [Liparis tanakae]